MRRRVDERAIPDVDASPRSAEHGDANARLGLGRRSFPFEDSRAALHPIRLPRPVEVAASLAVDPAVIRHEVQARAIGRGVSRIEPPQAVHDPIERPLPPSGVRGAEDVDEVVVRQEQSALLDGPLECGAFDREEFDLRREVVPRGLLSGRGRFVVDEERAVADPFRRPVEPSRFVLDDVDVRVEQAAFPVQDQAEVVIVPVPHRGAEAQDRREAARGPVARRFVGADHGESHARVEAARRRAAAAAALAAVRRASARRS